MQGSNFEEQAALQAFYEEGTHSPGLLEVKDSQSEFW